jgi:Flp pilus assembly protein TadD
MTRRAMALAALGVALWVSGCADVGQPNGWETTSTIQDPGDAKYLPSDEPYKKGVEHFNRGSYGLAERYFRDAVEGTPKNAAAWVGLAASYDRVRRFDLADRAYTQAILLSGETPQILNNRGYSYLLRGDLLSARAQFRRSADLDPNNPIVVNNLRLLDGSHRYIQTSD